MITYSVDLPTSAPCLLFTMMRVDGSVETFTNASVDITIGPTTWTKHPGLIVGNLTSRIDGTPPTMGFQAMLQSVAPLKFQDLVRGQYEGAHVQVELTSQDNPVTRDFVFDGIVLGETSYTPQGIGLFDLISTFAIPRDLLIEKFSLMCRYDFGSWIGGGQCRIAVFPVIASPTGAIIDGFGSDPPSRNTTYPAASWLRYRFGSDDTPEDFMNVILRATVQLGVTAVSEPTFSSTPGDLVTDGTQIWLTENAYARAAKIVSVSQHTITLDRLPDPRWATTLVPEQLKFFFASGEYKGRAFKGANWDSGALTLETYLPCPLAAVNDWIEIAPECSKTITMCQGYFQNAHNYGGFPYQVGAKTQAMQLGYTA